MVSAVLNVKIDEAVKEKLRQYAEANNENLSTATEKLLLLGLESNEGDVSEEDIDSQHTEEENASALSVKEIKALRKLLKKKK
ncbi:hypothetical protein [Pseudescherichia vulneris]|uniref:hypothetical protein n=1 Tax=Pseudescherichia vulneris TaxID=566 RepID=UPI000E96797A|nr:hypothetical protein [Pseudescherichia vulneris]HBC83693.1 hypothetical protein [Escherichia sp.]